ncbi:MAG: hypothetical protein QM791_22210 [Ferruginibacter sp.]
MSLLLKQPLKNITRYCLLPFLICILYTSCKKDGFTTAPDAKIFLSADTLKYDTVFTTRGSITQAFKINNTNSQKLLLSTVKLMGGNSSEYKINVNGVAAQEVNDIEIAANDSMYVFVTVNINPTAANLPFIVRDSILVTYNGNNRYVQLEAFGQNAHFLRNEIIKNNTTWTDDLPYVILGGIQVDTGVRLTINEGCKIYCNAAAPVLVDGTLTINGSKEKPVVFTGDRLDEDYRDFPASWPGIYFRGTSKNSIFNFTTIKNAYQAVAVQGAPDNNNPKLRLHQCIIDNAYDAGLICVNTVVFADNTLISNCGSNINIILGGAYDFTHCTVAAYSTYITHKKPVLTASNFAEIDGTVYKADLTAYFTNCIFWGEDGNVKDEIDLKKDAANKFDVLFDHCLYKAENELPLAPAALTGSIRNQAPLFDSLDVTKNYFDFRFTKNGGPAIDAGNTATQPSFPRDLDDRLRTDGKPDIGCYEKQ